MSTKLDTATIDRRNRLMASKMFNESTGFTAVDVGHYLTTRTKTCDLQQARHLLNTMHMDGKVYPRRSTRAGTKEGVVWCGVCSVWLKKPWRQVSNGALGIRIPPGPMEWSRGQNVT